ncbi:hypothetical protein O1611_g1800 [Lasiodiplodia mahajangana]|uniref:Uncharacterized protein n=1 Tax=Lasiodiplodia mahajangana TaxID=1108764 RepID=A0ACC2JWH3_9PEZI|nr:hypothetical protein O1611_g1800 [Lasiodiplodia mahajangana]
MVDKRKWGDQHINKSIKQIDAATWLIGDFILNRSPTQCDQTHWNDDRDHSSYYLSKRPSRVPVSTTPLDTPYIQLVHESGDASAVWSIGSTVLCKARYIEEGVTPESVTLDFVQSKHPSFETPKVLFHAWSGDRSFLFTQRLPGRTLDSAWPSLSEYWKRYYVSAIADACQEMAEWRGGQVGGVGKQLVPECFLVTPPGGDDFSSVPAGCKAIGMDCADVMFYHADLGPSNIIVEDKPRDGKFGIIDFEISGYFPRGWIRTKFRISSGMDFSASASDCSTWWRSEMQKALETRGFEDYSQAWMEWRGYK